MKFNIKNIFLLDSSGAGLSFCITVFVLPVFSQFFGVSAKTFLGLGLLAFTLFFYSLYCYLYARASLRRALLKALIFMNLSYVVLIAAILFTSTTLTVYGKAYFTLESIVIISLVFLEYRVWQAQT